MQDGEGRVDVKDGEWRVRKYFDTKPVDKWVMVLIDGGESRVSDKEFMTFCQKFMRVGQDLGKPLDLFSTGNESSKFFIN